MQIDSGTRSPVILFKIKLKGVEIDSLIKTIEDRKFILWQKTWDTLDHFIGVYIFSPIEAIGTIGVNVVLDFYKETQNCSLTVIGLGEGGSEGHFVHTAEKSIKSDLIELAQIEGWGWREDEVETTIIQCPHCLYMHTPFELKILGEGIIECRNCGQEFMLDDVPKADDAEYSRVECPACGSVEDYKDYQVSWDRKVSCPTCGKTILLDEASRRRYHPKEYFPER
jgi:DNA-directed RNA polymerase subunit RPC12/RpoP